MYVNIRGYIMLYPSYCEHVAGEGLSQYNKTNS